MQVLALKDQNGAEIVHIGEGWAGDHLIAQHLEKPMRIVVAPGREVVAEIRTSC